MYCDDIEKDDLKLLKQLTKYSHYLFIKGVISNRRKTENSNFKNNEKFERNKSGKYEKNSTNTYRNSVDRMFRE